MPSSDLLGKADKLKLMVELPNWTSTMLLTVAAFTNVTLVLRPFNDAWLAGNDFNFQMVLLIFAGTIPFSLKVLLERWEQSVDDEAVPHRRLRE